MNEMNCTNSLMHEFVSVSHKHKRHFSVVVNMPDCSASDLGSIPRSSLPIFDKFILLNSSNSTRLMKKLNGLWSSVILIG